MGLALSDLPISVAVVSAAPATFLGALHTLLLAAGWTAATYLTGHVYACQSPQGLTVQVRIWDPADASFPSCVAFQWLSSTAPYPVGHVHHVRVNSAFTYTVWANCCSLFVGRTSYPMKNIYPNETLPFTVAGGVLWSSGLTTPTPECSEQTVNAPEVTSELWFSCGTDSGVSGFAALIANDFRNGHYAQRSTLCRNGVVVNGSGENEATGLQLGILRPSGYVNYLRQGFDAGVLHKDGTPMASDPWVMRAGEYFGMLWDACLLSARLALEDTVRIEETDEEGVEVLRTTDWVNYMYGGVGSGATEGRFSSLLLLTDVRGTFALGNVAY